MANILLYVLFLYIPYVGHEYDVAMREIRESDRRIHEASERIGRSIREDTEILRRFNEEQAKKK